MEHRNVSLTLTHIATVLAALSSGCTKAEPAAAVHADQPMATASAMPPPPPPAPSAAPMEEAKGEAEPAPSASAVTPQTPSHQRLRAPTGQASCGAGTCSADMKKKK